MWMSLFLDLGDLVLVATLAVLTMVIYHMLIISSCCVHYVDVIMTTMAPQITSLTVVYSIVYSGADQRKQQSSASLAFLCGEFTGTGEFPTQRASNAENFFIWWRPHCPFINGFQNMLIYVIILCDAWLSFRLCFQWHESNITADTLFCMVWKSKLAAQYWSCTWLPYRVKQSYIHHDLYLTPCHSTSMIFSTLCRLAAP